VRGSIYTLEQRIEFVSLEVLNGRLSSSSLERNVEKGLTLRNTLGLLQENESSECVDGG
jgi:hypothetical protein